MPWAASSRSKSALVESAGDWLAEPSSIRGFVLRRQLFAHDRRQRRGDDLVAGRGEMEIVRKIGERGVPPAPLGGAL